MKKKIAHIFGNPKIFSTIPLIGSYKKNGIVINSISRKMDLTYTHANRLVFLFEEAGIVDSEKKGRGKFITLTDKGKKLEKHLLAIIPILNEEYGG